jgi:hypothetical protein
MSGGTTGKSRRLHVQVDFSTLRRHTRPIALDTFDNAVSRALSGTTANTLSMGLTVQRQFASAHCFVAVLDWPWRWRAYCYSNRIRAMQVTESIAGQWSSGRASSRHENHDERERFAPTLATCLSSIALRIAVSNISRAQLSERVFPPVPDA